MIAYCVTVHLIVPDAVMNKSSYLVTVLLSHLHCLSGYSIKELLGVRGNGFKRETKFDQQFIKWRQSNCNIRNDWCLGQRYIHCLSKFV